MRTITLSHCIDSEQIFTRYQKVDFWNKHIQSLGPKSEVAKVNPRLRKNEYRYS